MSYAILRWVRAAGLGQDEAIRFDAPAWRDLRLPLARHKTWLSSAAASGVAAREPTPAFNPSHEPEDAEVIAIEAPIAFSANGAITAGITHAPGNAGITLVTTGTYKITFSVSGVEPSQFALFINGALVGGSIYGSGAGTQQNTGQVIITAGAGDVLSVVNHSSAAAVTLQTLAGGTQTNTNASVTIEKVA